MANKNKIEDGIAYALGYTIAMLEEFWRIIAIVGGVIAGVYATNIQDPIAHRWFESIVLLVGIHKAQLLVFFTIISLGVVAHGIKRLNQSNYGMLEIVFGAVSAFSISSNMKPGEPLFGKWAVLIGCAYVIARGLNNVHDARARAVAANVAKPPLA